MKPVGPEPLDRWVLPLAGVVPAVIDDRPVTGAMAPFLGKRYSVEEVWKGYLQSQPERVDDIYHHLAPTIRAYAAPSLEGLEFTTTNIHDMAQVLQEMVARNLPTIAWEPLVMDTGAIKKYGIVHVLMPAPIDETTGDAMILEIFGMLLHANHRPAGRLWFEEYKIPGKDGDLLEFDEITAKVQVATYANTIFPNIGIPFYM